MRERTALVEMMAERNRKAHPGRSRTLRLIKSVRLCGVTSVYENPWSTPVKMAVVGRYQCL